MAGLRTTRAWLCVFLLLVLSIPLTPLLAHAEENSTGPPDTSFSGVYQVSGVTSTGAPFASTVIVTPIGADTIQFAGEYDGWPVSTYGRATWAGDDEVSVPLSVGIPFVASGSGTVVLTRAAGGWNLTASGSGQVLGNSGTATASGFGGGVAPTRAEVTEVTGVSETLQAADEALAALQPAEAQPDVATDDALEVMAFVLFLVFIWILLDLILGTPFLSGA